MATAINGADGAGLGKGALAKKDDGPFESEGCRLAGEEGGVPASHSKAAARVRPPSAHYAHHTVGATGFLHARYTGRGHCVVECLWTDFAGHV